MINLINKLLFLLNLPLITKYSPYSREERNKIYKEALTWYTENCKKSNNIGLCISVAKSYGDFGHQIKNFPELYLHNSILLEYKYGEFYYYWSKFKKEPRIKALERAIKLTE